MRPSARVQMASPCYGRGVCWSTRCMCVWLCVVFAWVCCVVGVALAACGVVCIVRCRCVIRCSVSLRFRERTTHAHISPHIYIYRCRSILVRSIYTHMCAYALIYIHISVYTCCAILAIKVSTRRSVLSGGAVGLAAIDLLHGVYALDHVYGHCARAFVAISVNGYMQTARRSLLLFCRIPAPH